MCVRQRWCAQRKFASRIGSRPKPQVGLQGPRKLPAWRTTAVGLLLFAALGKMPTSVPLALWKCMPFVEVSLTWQAGDGSRCVALRDAC